MGRVYRARRDRGGGVVALKVLKESFQNDESQLRRFVREARAAREVANPHLIEVLDAGEVDGRAYLAMRYIDGPSLADELRVGGALPVAEAVCIVRDVSAALDVLHAAGMVHRDVKPSNIMLDPQLGAVLTDFGLAKRRGYSALTRPGEMLGTLQYLAPEVFRGDEPGPPADLYALGCTAFACLAGGPPFAGRGTFALGLAHLDEEPPDPCAGRDDTPEALGMIVCQALAKDPAQRPRSAGAYARMLRVAGGSA
jgi:serine/threonine-protein kinase